MRSRVGKIFIIALAMMNDCAHATRISLHVRDHHYQPCTRVAAGQPVTIEVALSDVGNTRSEPTIAGLEKAQLRRTSFNMTTINGVSAVTYAYRVYFDEPGTYVIGPATIAGNNAQSKVVTLEVTSGDRAPTTQASLRRSSAANTNEPTLRLTVDKKKAFVGQRVTCTLRLCYQQDSAQLVRIGSDVAGPEIKHESGPHHTRETINGDTYECVTWQWDVYPDRAGTLTVPAYWNDIVLPFRSSSPRPQTILAWIAMHNGIHQRIYSNAVTIHVQEKPAAFTDVPMIGSFDACTATIQPATIQAHEAAVYTLSLYGDHNGDDIPVPLLQELPDTLKAYPSKRSTKEVEPHRFCTQFEYIIQGLSEGTWAIPAQKIVYGDVATKSRALIVSNSVELRVAAGAALPASVVHTSTTSCMQVFDKAPKQPSLYEPDGLCTIQQTLSDVYPSPIIIPLWLMIVFMIMLPTAIIAVHYRRQLFDVIIPYVSAHNAQRAARSQIGHAQRTRNAKALYPIMMQFIAYKKQVPVVTIHEEQLNEWLRGVLTDEQRRAWDRFFALINEYHFGCAQPINNAIFEQARQWIELLGAAL